MAGRGRQDWSWVGKKACMTPGRHVVEHHIIGGLPDNKIRTEADAFAFLVAQCF